MKVCRNVVQHKRLMLTAYPAALYASVSASFIIEQSGLPTVTPDNSGHWNNDSPARRLEALKARQNAR